MSTFADFLDAPVAPAAPAAPPAPPPAPVGASPVRSAASPAPVAVRPASTIQRITPTAAQMAEVRANNEADLRGVAESKRQQAAAIAQQMAAHIQKGDTASATAAAAQLGALNREIQAIGGAPIPMPGASAPAMPMAFAPQTGTLSDFIHLPVPAAAGAPGGPPAPPSATQHFIDAFNTIRKNKPAFLASTADVVAGLPAGVLNFIGTASGRLTGETPEKSQQIGQAISSFAASPFGRLTGTTESPQYQGLQRAVAAPFEYAGSKLATATGMNPVDANLIVNAATMGLPEAKKFVSKNIAAAAELPTVRAGRTTVEQAEQRAAANAAASDQLRQQFAARQAAAKAAERPADFGAAYTTATEPPLFKPPVELTLDESGVYRDTSGAPIPRVEISAGFPPERQLPGAFGEEPVAPVTAEAPPVAAEAPASIVKEPLDIPQLEENPPMPTTALSVDELARREQALRDVGIENIRKSAIENNPKQASSQYITSKADQGVYGSGMTDQINHEKQALNNHFSQIENDAGGKVVRYGTNNETADKMNAGQTLKNGLQTGYDNWMQEGHDLYNQADEAIGGNTVTLPKLNDMLKQSEHFPYEQEKGLQNGILSYLQRSKLLDANGDIIPVTAKQAEGIRQYINSKYNYETKDVSKNLKKSIDTDVFEQVGGPTYEAARKHWEKGINTYEDPKAMGDLLADNGVNQKIPDEKVMDKLAGLPESQFAHVIETLRTDGQNAAINQAKTSLVNQIRRAGQSEVNEPWNARAATKEASTLSQKLKIAFADDPKALQNIYKGIEAGTIIHIPSKYPGAAVQAHLLNRKFDEMLLQKGLTATGAAIGGTAGSIFGPAGAAAGAGLGGTAGGYLGEKMTASSIGKRQAEQLGEEIKSGTPINKIKDLGK